MFNVEFVKNVIFLEYKTNECIYEYLFDILHMSSIKYGINPIYITDNTLRENKYALLKKEHDQLFKNIYHETFLLYQEGKIEEINKIKSVKL